MDCAILGAGFVGTPLAAVLALHNPSTKFYVLDINQTLVSRWKALDPPFHEDGLVDVLKQTLGRNLYFTCNPEEVYPHCDKYFICVNTYSKRQGLGADYATDMSAVLNCVDELCEYYSRNDLPLTPVSIIEKSTVPYKTSELIRGRIARQLGGKNAGKSDRFVVMSNPEFLAEGRLIRDNHAGPGQARPDSHRVRP